jgi:hypothetical protein
VTTIRKRLLAAPFVLVLAALLAVFAVSDTHAKFDPTLEVTVADTTPETASDFTVDFGLPKGDVNFAGVVSYIPSNWGFIPGDKIQQGAIVGELRADATLGLINGACNTALPVEFTFRNASIDIEDTIPFPDDEEDDDTTAEFAEDNDGNEIEDGIDKYPEFLNRVFDDKQPLRRSAGVTIVAGIPVLLQFLVFPPGTEINENIPADETLGYPSVTVLQNAGDPDAEPAPSPITDFCTPLQSKNTSFGVTPDEDRIGVTEPGQQLWVNPQAGDYTFSIVSAGLRDADGDGLENSLDTCPFDPNQGDPRVGFSGDLDGDGLDAACDPNDDSSTGGTNSDEDGDGYVNRQDNCPLIANGEEEGEADPDNGNQRDGDLDQIGRACDPNPDEADGELIILTNEAPITIGGGGGEGGPPSAEACPNCLQPGDVPPPDDNGNGGDDGGNSGILIAIIIAAIIAVVVIGGLLFLMRGRMSGGSGGSGGSTS